MSKGIHICLIDLNFSSRVRLCVPCLVLSWPSNIAIVALVLFLFPAHIFKMLKMAMFVGNI